MRRRHSGKQCLDNKVTSDEPENLPGDGDGNTTVDMVISADCKSVALRSERNKGGDGRVYTLHLAVKDAAGNTGTATAKVYVQASQSSATAVDNGVAYTVTAGCAAATTTASNRQAVTHLSIVSPEGLQVSALPNPSAGQFTLVTQSVSGEVLGLTVTDAAGRLVERRTGVAANGTLYFGKNYRSGIYVVEVLQGGQRQVLKLVKL